MHSAVVLRRIDAAQNMARFYRLDVQPDLFGSWSFIREWGRIGRPGTVRALPCPTEAEARAMLEKHWRVRQRRGYS